MNTSISHRLLLSALLLAPLGTANAQGTFLHFPSNAPGTGTCSRVPFGAETADVVHRNQLLQLYVTATELGNVPRVLSTLSFAPCSQGTHSYGRLQIRMNHRSGGFTNDFRTNLGSGAASVLDETEWDWQHGANTWTPVRLDRAFHYDPARGDLVIQIRVTNADFTGTAPEFHHGNRTCLAVSNYSGAPPRQGTMLTSAPRFRLGDRMPVVTRYGAACGSGPLTIDNLGTARVGTSFSLQLSAANPNSSSSAAVIWIGFQRLDRTLSGVGATGCWLLTPPQVDVGVLISGSTSNLLTFQLPNDPAIAGGHAFAQGAHLDNQANALGVAVSGALTLAVGH